MSESPQPVPSPDQLPMDAGSIRIEHEPVVHGPDGVLRLVDISKVEARVLVLHYLNEIRKVEDILDLGCVGTSLLNDRTFCSYRINKLQDSGILSAEEVKQIVVEFHGGQKAKAIQHVEEAARNGELYLARRNGDVWALFDLGTEEKIQRTIDTFGEDLDWKTGPAAELLGPSRPVRVYPPARID